MELAAPTTATSGPQAGTIGQQYWFANWSDGGCVRIEPSEFAKRDARSHLGMDVTSKFDSVGDCGVRVSCTATALFTADGSGSGPLDARNQEETINSIGNPVSAGATVGLFMNGAGAVSGRHFRGLYSDFKELVALTGCDSQRKAGVAGKLGR